MTDPSQLLGPDGTPVSVDDLADKDSVVVHVAEVDLIPTTVHGFSVHWKLGPYPIDSPRTHRKAVYVELWPVDERARKLCKEKNRERMHAFTPLTAKGAAILDAEPQGQFAEEVVLDTLRAAVRELRKYLRVPRQPFERKRRS